MIPVPKIIGFGVMCLITTFLPIGFVLYGIIKKNKGFPIMPLLFGVLSFFISQIILRIPLLQLASTASWYRGFASTIVGVVVLSGLSAGLFEESSRLIFGSTAMKKHMNWQSVLMFGLGHGLCEVVFLVGAVYLNNFTYSILINQNTLLMGAAAVGVVGDTDIIANLTAQLNSVQWWQMCMVVLERLVSIVFHISMTVLVFRGLLKSRNRFGWVGWYLLAILFHTITNTVSVFLASKSLVLSEVVLLILVVPMAFLALKQKKYFPPAVKSLVRRGRTL